MHEQTDLVELGTIHCTTQQFYSVYRVGHDRLYYIEFRIATLSQRRWLPSWLKSDVRTSVVRTTIST